MELRRRRGAGDQRAVAAGPAQTTTRPRAAVARPAHRGPARRHRSPRRAPAGAAGPAGPAHRCAGTPVPALPPAAASPAVELDGARPLLRAAVRDGQGPADGLRLRRAHRAGGRPGPRRQAGVAVHDPDLERAVRRRADRRGDPDALPRRPRGRLQLAARGRGHGHLGGGQLQRRARAASRPRPAVPVVRAGSRGPGDPAERAGVLGGVRADAAPLSRPRPERRGHRRHRRRCQGAGHR